MPYLQLPALRRHLAHLLSLALLFLLLSSPSRAQQPADSVFADAPRETLDLTGESTFALFKPAFYHNQVFLLGETHGVQRVQEVDFALLRHLNQRAGVRHYLAELDCAQAYYLNEYLRTGNELTLSRVFAGWVRSQAVWGNAEFAEKVRRIRQLNQRLPVRRRICFVGIDGVQDPALVADYLAELGKGLQALPAATAASLDSVQEALRASNGQAARVALRTQQVLRAAAPASRQALGVAGYTQLQYVLTNVGYARTLPEREAQLFANYQAALDLWHLHHEKLYGLWGLGHVLQRPALGGYVDWAARLHASTLPGHDKLVSILCTYSGCRMMTASATLPTAWQTPNQPFTACDKYNHDGPLVVLPGLAPLLAATQPGSTTLVRLDAPGTTAHRLPVQLRYAPGLPASQQLRLDPALPATAYVQYLLLVRDSPATQPFAPAAVATSPTH
jgi:hypothetical protein